MKRLPETISVFGKVFSAGEETLDLSSRNLYRIQESVIRAIRPRNLSLANIRVLNFSQNSFVELPDILPLLINLRCLSVKDNRLSSLPESIKCLKILRVLDLRNNQLKALGVVRELPKLEKLFVEGNPLTIEEIRSLVKHMDGTGKTISMDIAGTC